MEVMLQEGNGKAIHPVAPSEGNKGSLSDGREKFTHDNREKGDAISVLTHEFDENENVSVFPLTR